MASKGAIRLLSACLIIASLHAAADVTLTMLANEGVVLSDGASAIIIDGLVTENYAIYGGLSPEQQAALTGANGPFSSIGLALASHRHHDHNQPDAACRFLQSRSRTQFVSSAQVIDLVREKCRQLVTTEDRIRIIDPQYGTPEVLSIGDITIRIFLLSHGRGNYARLQNYGHLVSVGGLKVLHVGDAAMDPEDYRRAGLEQVDLDVALVPFWYFQPGPDYDIVQTYMHATHLIAVHIPPGEVAEVTAHLEENFPGVMVFAQPLEQVSFSPTVRTKP